MWLRAFIDVGWRRLVDLGYLTAGEGESIWRTFLEFEHRPGSWMINPGVLEMVASSPAATPKIG
jgi:hypothetical protein